MQAIEFEAIAHQRTIHIPDTVPDGVMLRVLLLLDENTHSPPKQSEQTANSEEGETLKALLASMTEGLTDEDLFRPREFGRELPEWDT